MTTGPSRARGKRVKRTNTIKKQNDQGMGGERKGPTVEQVRLLTDGPAWKRWGPYLSERQWGTVREDYGDNGAGLGASHQTGWAGLVARMIQLYGLLDGKKLLEGGKQAIFTKGTA